MNRIYGYARISRKEQSIDRQIRNIRAACPDVHVVQEAEAGVPVKVVSERLGHSSAKMTLDVYAHVIDHQQDKAVAALEEYMKE